MVYQTRDQFVGVPAVPKPPISTVDPSRTLVSVSLRVLTILFNTTRRLTD